MGIGKRIKEARLNRGLTQEELSRLLGVTKGAIANYENETSHPKEPIMYKLIEVLNVDANYLFQDAVNIPKKVNDVTFAEYEHIKKYRDLDDYGKRLVDTVIDQEAERSKTQKQKETSLRAAAMRPETTLYSVPYAYDLPASAGTGEYAMDIAHFKNVGLSEEPPRKADFLIRVAGDSMEPKFSDGDKVFVQRMDAIEAGEIGLFYFDGDVYIKKLGQNELISLNAAYPPIPVKEFASFRCFGKVLGKCTCEITEI